MNNEALAHIDHELRDITSALKSVRQTLDDQPESTYRHVIAALEMHVTSAITSVRSARYCVASAQAAMPQTEDREP
jgi:hypothetical protein